MKKLLLCLLLGMLLFTITACSDDDDEGSSNSSFPSGLYEEDPDDLDFDQFLIIRPDEYSAYEVDIWLISLVEPDDWEFELDGEDIDVDWYEDYYNDDWWYGEIDYDDLEDIDFDAGETIDYYLEVNNNVYEGEFEMLDQLDVDWDDFDFDEDFEFDWDIDENPQIYNVYLEFWCEEDSVEDDFDEYWEISGSEDEFIISNNLYEDYDDCDYYDFDVDMYAINYVNHGNGLVWTETYAEYWDTNWDKSTHKQRAPKDRIRKTIEMFKKKFKNEEEEK